MDLTALRASARRKCGANITTAGYTDVMLDANLNEWLREVTGWVMLATGRWEFNGSVYTTNLVQSQVAYTFPVTMVAVNRVEIKYPNQDTYVKAIEIDDKQVDDAFQNDSITVQAESAPRYRLIGQTVRIYPVPSAAVTNGLAIELMSDVTELSAISDVPVLNPLIHKVLAVGASYEYFMMEKMMRQAEQARGRIFGRYDGDPASLKYQVETLAATRDQSVKQRLVPRTVSYR